MNEILFNSTLRLIIVLGILSIIVFIYLTGNNPLVTINVTLYAPTPLMNITLPVRPLGPVTVVNSTGQSIPYYIVNNEVYLSMVSPGNITITYAPYINVLNNGTLQLRINTDYETQVYIANNVLPTAIPSNIQGFQETSNGIILTLAPGNYVINFITTGPTITTETTTQHITKTNTSQSIPYPSLSYIIVIIVVALALSILLIVRHRR